MIDIMFDVFYTALQQIGEPKICLKNGESLFRRGDEVKSVHLLISGCVHLSRTFADGRDLIINRHGERSIVAEASIYSKSYHCDAMCMEDCTIVRLAVGRFHDILAQNGEHQGAWAAHLAHNLQQARARNELLTLKTVSQRLSAWLEWQGGKLPAKGNWKSVAFELGVSPEALYREIARRDNRSK